MASQMRKCLLTLLLALMLSVGMSGLSLTSASAASYPPPTSGETGGDHGGGGGDNGGGGNNGGGNNGGGTGGGGGGGTSGTWSYTKVYKGNPISKTFRAPAQESSSSGSRTLTCSGGNSFGKWVGMKAFVFGATTTFDGSEGDAGSYRYHVLSGATKTCLSPPKYTDRQVQCGWTVGAVGHGPAGNPRVASTTKTYPVSSTKFRTGGARSISECPKSMIQSYNWKTVEFGRWSLAATGRAVTCTIRDYYAADYFGNKPADKIIGCGSPHLYSHNQVKWTVYCGGHALGWPSGHSFTEEECGDTTKVGTPYRWSCGLASDSTPWLSGIRNSKEIEVFHDAKKRPLTWTQPKISGKVKNVANKQAKLLYKSGTPFRTGVSAGDATQHFEFDPTITSNHTGWTLKGASGKTTWNGQFYKAGLPGTVNNLHVAPVWTFTADFAVSATTIKTVNWATGAITTSSSTVYNNNVATCTGDPSNLAVTRARTSN